MPGPFYFAWSGAGEEWSAGHLREDEDVFAVEIRQVEGDFATLQIDIVNPRVGLLAAGRNVWAWLSYGGDHLQAAAPIFFGRLIGIPENLFEEIVRLQFVAKPTDYVDQKTVLADVMKVPPFYDPVWLQQNINDPDTVLEAYSKLWHIDRVSLDVSTSDIIQGEDGMITVTPDDHFYDEMTVTFGQTPLQRVDVKGTVSWTQTGKGSVDLTDRIVAAFQAAGSPLPSPLIMSLTGDGLLSAWPAPDSSLGGGWTMAADSYAVPADWIKQAYYVKVFAAIDPFPQEAPIAKAPDPIPFGDTTVSLWTSPGAWEYPTANFNNFAPWSAFYGIAPLKIWAYMAPTHPISIRFDMNFNGNIKRSETVSFSLAADVQPIMTDPAGAETTSMELSSSAITDPIDPGGAIPIGDPGRSSYFKTARGDVSFQYLLLLARAKLLSRARCVLVKFVTTWDFALGITCRMNVRLEDYRLPGGGVIGKVTGYVLTYSTDRIQAEITIACTVGHGGTQEAVPGDPGYVQVDYVDFYQSLIGGEISLQSGEITYLSFDNFDIVGGDIDLFNMTPDSVLKPVPAASLETTLNIREKSTSVFGMADTTGLEKGLVYQITADPAFIPDHTTMKYDDNGRGTLSAAALQNLNGLGVIITSPGSNGIQIINGPSDQVAAIDASVSSGNKPRPEEALKATATQVCLSLVGVDGGSFHTDFPMQVSMLMVPETVDLEA